MNSEQHIPVGANRSLKIFYLSGAILAITIAIGCGIIASKLEQTAAAEHARAMDALSENASLKNQVSEEGAAIENLKQMLARANESSAQTLNDSIARLQFKTILVTSLPDQSAQAGLPVMMQRAGLIGLLLDVVQAEQREGRAVQHPAQVWILPTKLEPMFAGDSSRAWVIHADASTGKPVDAPHHPAPVMQNQN